MGIDDAQSVPVSPHYFVNAELAGGSGHPAEILREVAVGHKAGAECLRATLQASPDGPLVHLLEASDRRCVQVIEIVPTQKTPAERLKSCQLLIYPLNELPVEDLRF